MSVQELSSLHGRYVDLSSRFRAAWAFHQFIQSIQKVLMDGTKSRHASTFQDVYIQLKSLSQKLNASELESLKGELEAVAGRLDELTDYLLDEDSKVSPHFLRQFFQRVKRYDEKILIQLIKFYLYAAAAGRWNLDRSDKSDFLLTRLGEESADSNGPGGLKDRRHLREVLTSLWKVLEVREPPDEGVTGYCDAVTALCRNVETVSTLDELCQRGLVIQYRELKHSMGLLTFHPRIALAVIEANLILRYAIQQLYGQEERRFITEYQRIFELEQEVAVDSRLEWELKEFRTEVEKFEELLQDKELRLEDFVRIRERVRSLMGRLEELAPDDGVIQGVTISDLSVDLGDLRAVPELPPSTTPGVAGAEVFAEALERMMAALEESNAMAPARTVALSREMFPFRLEPREVVAFRRFRSDPGCDKEMEKFLLETAALRIRINEQAEEVRDLLDDTTATGNSPVYDAARRTLRVADACQRLFRHMLDRVILTGDAAEAQNLQILEMRLLRDYSGLWLLVYKPFLPNVR